MPQWVYNRNKASPTKVVWVQYWDFSFFANFIKDEWSFILKVQCIDSHIISIQHLFDVIRSQELRMKVYLRIRINTLQTLCQTFCHNAANTCTTKEYFIILDDDLFSFAYIEPVSAVSFFHNKIIILGKSRCNKAYILYTKV